MFYHKVYREQNWTGLHFRIFNVLYFPIVMKPIKSDISSQEQQSNKTFAIKAARINQNFQRDSRKNSHLGDSVIPFISISFISLIFVMVPINKFNYFLLLISSQTRTQGRTREDFCQDKFIPLCTIVIRNEG